MHSPSEAKRILEAALLAAPEPLGITELKRLFEGEINADTMRKLLAELAEEWQGRAVGLVSLSSGRRLQTRPGVPPFLHTGFPETPPRQLRGGLWTAGVPRRARE